MCISIHVVPIELIIFNLLEKIESQGKKEGFSDGKGKRKGSSTSDRKGTSS